jgi:hypothetical protein
MAVSGVPRNPDRPRPFRNRGAKRTWRLRSRSMAGRRGYAQRVQRAGRVRENARGAVVTVLLTRGGVSGGELESSRARGSGCGRALGGVRSHPERSLANQRSRGHSLTCTNPGKNAGKMKRREVFPSACRVNRCGGQIRCRLVQLPERKPLRTPYLPLARSEIAFACRKHLPAWVEPADRYRRRREAPQVRVSIGGRTRLSFGRKKLRACSQGSQAAEGSNDQVSSRADFQLDVSRRSRLPR